MTRFSVVWVEEARDELAEIWLKSADRMAVAAAADAIDCDLSEDAVVKGN
jgi:hypothetical protein